MPFHNNEATLSHTMHSLRALTLPKGLRLTEVIFINDGSTDDTLLLLKRAKTTILRPFRKAYPKADISLITYRNTQGVGFAIQQGMLQSTADYTICVDPSMPIAFTELEKCLPSMQQQLGVIHAKKLHRASRANLRSKIQDKFTNKITNITNTDFHVGFYAFSQKAKEFIFSKTYIHGWGYEAEIAYLINRYRLTKKEKVLTTTPASLSFAAYVRLLPAVLVDLLAIKWHHEWKQTSEQLIADYESLPQAVHILSRFSK